MGKVGLLVGLKVLDLRKLGIFNSPVHECSVETSLLNGITHWIPETITGHIQVYPHV